MNDHEFEQIARRAAADLRAEAERIADSQSSLALLMTSRPEAIDSSSSTVVAFEHARPPRRSPWLPILIAASTIAVLSGVVWLAGRSGNESIIVTTEPSQPELPEQPDVTTAERIDVTVPIASNDPGTTGPPVPTTLSPSAPSAIPFVFDVPDEIGQPLARTELLTASVGSGDFELGWEDCQECEPLRPWAPVVDTAGTIYVADVVNARWRVVGQGASRTIPFADGEVVAGSPVIGPDGLLYAPVAAELNQTAPRRVAAYDPSTLAVVASYPVGTTVYDHLELVNGQLLLGDTVVTSFELQLGTPTVEIDHDAGLVTISLSGTQRQFQFPDNWLINGRDAVPIDDGSVVVRALAGVDTDDRSLVLVRLWLDGTTEVGTIENDSTTNGAVQITADGLVQLERTTVAHYDLPDFAGVDPLVGWTVPEFDQPDLAQVPRLLPRQAATGVAKAVRTEGAESAVDQPSYLQTWVRTAGTDVVDGVVQIDTRFAPLPIGNPAVEVQVPRWPQAYFSTTTSEVDTLQTRSATRSMTVWTTGLDREAVVTAAASLQVDVDGAGWLTPDLPRPDGWILVHEGWFSGIASRTLHQQQSDGSDSLELWTVHGYPDAIGTPGLLPDNNIKLGAIDGHPALLFDRPSRAAVTWSPSDDVVVVLGMRGPLDDLIQVAESVVPVDQPTWEAASTLDTSPDDGCNSMFC